MAWSSRHREAIDIHTVPLARLLLASAAGMGEGYRCMYDEATMKQLLLQCKRILVLFWSRASITTVNTIAV